MWVDRGLVWHCWHRILLVGIICLRWWVFFVLLAGFCRACSTPPCSFVPGGSGDACTRAEVLVLIRDSANAPDTMW